MTTNILQAGLDAQAASIGKGPLVDTFKEVCPRCAGSGFQESQYVSGHTSTGTCFRCAGSGSIEYNRKRPA